MDIEFPVMGQALPIELSNTLWVHAGRVIDALSTVGGTSRWVATIAPRLPESPPDVDEDLRAGLVALRQSVRAVLAATVTAQPLPPEALSRLSAASRAAPAWWEIAWESDRPVARRHRRGSPSRGILATLADDTISLVAGRGDLPSSLLPRPGLHRVLPPGQSPTTLLLPHLRHARARRRGTTSGTRTLRRSAAATRPQPGRVPRRDRVLKSK